MAEHGQSIQVSRGDVGEGRSPNSKRWICYYRELAFDPESNRKPEKILSEGLALLDLIFKKVTLETTVMNWEGVSVKGEQTGRDRSDPWEK